MDTGGVGCVLLGWSNARELESKLLAKSHSDPTPAVRAILWVPAALAGVLDTVPHALTAVHST